jgi:hypothetical protein
MPQLLRPRLLPRRLLQMLEFLVLLFSRKEISWLAQDPAHSLCFLLVPMTICWQQTTPPELA